MKHSLHHTCHYPTRMCMVMNHTYNTGVSPKLHKPRFCLHKRAFWGLLGARTAQYHRRAMEYGYIYHAASKMCVQEHTTHELRTYTSATYGR